MQEVLGLTCLFLFSSFHVQIQLCGCNDRQACDNQNSMGSTQAAPLQLLMKVRLLLTIWGSGKIQLLFSRSLTKQHENHS